MRKPTRCIAVELQLRVQRVQPRAEPSNEEIAFHGPQCEIRLPLSLQNESRPARLEARAHLNKNIGLTEKEFLTQIFANIDTAGTELEKEYPPRKGAKT